MTVGIAGDNMYAFVMHTANKKKVLIIFDTFQAYFVIPPKLVALLTLLCIAMVMYCHGYVLPWLCYMFVVVVHTPVANINPGLSCVPNIIIEHFIINKPLMLA